MSLLRRSGGLQNGRFRDHWFRTTGKLVMQWDSLRVYHAADKAPCDHPRAFPATCRIMMDIEM